MHTLYLLSNLLSILPDIRLVNNCHVFFCHLKLSVITEIDIKYCCNIVHAVNFA